MTQAENKQQPAFHGEKDEHDLVLPAVSVGVITHEKRRKAFAKLLRYLGPALSAYGGTCELVIGNNSGPDALSAVDAEVDASGLRGVCECRIVNSEKNNIATGRNTVFNAAKFDLVAFIDDDEFPTENWLIQLVTVKCACQCEAVAGPILPVFDLATTTWVKTVDIHNVQGLANEQRITMAASGNFLIEKQWAQTITLNEQYGKTGGSDTEFFLRLNDAGVRLYWAKEATVYEDIPADRSTVSYTLRRCMSQGTNFRRILTDRGEISSPILFSARAGVVFVGSLIVGLCMIAIGHEQSGKWMKRSFSNLGKLIRPKSLLYG